MPVEKSLRIYWHLVSGIVRKFTYEKVYCYEHQGPNVLFLYKTCIIVCSIYTFKKKEILGN